MENNYTDIAVGKKVDEFDKLMALDKLNEEMEKEHSPVEDNFHNWLCDTIPNDSELTIGVLKAERTISGCLAYVMNKAKEQAVNNAACIWHEEVYGWVREYFVSDEIEVKPAPKAKVNNSSLSTSKSTVNPLANKSKDKKKEVAQEEQLSLF